MKGKACLLCLAITINETALIQSQMKLCASPEEALEIIDKAKEGLFDNEILKAHIFKLDLVGEAFGYGKEAIKNQKKEEPIATL